MCTEETWDSTTRQAVSCSNARKPCPSLPGWPLPSEQRARCVHVYGQTMTIPARLMLERGSGANHHHHLPSIAALSKSASRKEFARGKTLIGFSCMVTDHGEIVGLFQKTVKRHKLGESTRSGQGAVANVGCLLLSWQVVAWNFIGRTQPQSGAAQAA